MRAGIKPITFGKPVSRPRRQLRGRVFFWPNETNIQEAVGAQGLSGKQANSDTILIIG